MRKWAIGIVASLIAGSLLAFIYVDHELSKMYGGKTQTADVRLTNDAPSKYVLANVNVLAPTADRFIRSQSVLIENKLIKSVEENFDLADDTPTIDGKGMFLVPGYTDSHVHLWESENDLLLYTANGVTQIREMNGDKFHLRWKEEIEEGRLGPEIFVVAPQLATFSFFEGLFVGWTQKKTIVRSQEQVNRAVRSFKKMGYDAVKASSFLDAAGYAALSKAAEDNDIPLVGHIPLAVGPNEYLNSTQTETAHVEELMKALNREFGGFTSKNTHAFLKFVRVRSSDLAMRLRESGKSVTSTLTLIDSFHQQKSDLASVLNDVALQYANPGITEGVGVTSRGMGWLPDVNIYRWPDDLSKEQKQDSITYWKAYAEAQHIVFEALLDKGVPIMAGTDANVPAMTAGFSLHDEMAALHEAGMQPSQVLASATRVPGEWMGANTGEISAGFKANLVLLRENPLEDIGATDSIEMVMLNGRLLSRNDLDQILLSVRKANDASRKVQIDDQ